MAQEGGKWVSTPEGRHLAGRVSQDTAPEKALRRAIHAQGARFRMHRTLAPGCTPDLVLPKHRLAVFVDGCFWHSCPEHGRSVAWAGPNASLWAAKMLANTTRDERSSAAAVRLGWTVVRVWEHEVMQDPVATATRILDAAASRPN